MTTLRENNVLCQAIALLPYCFKSYPDKSTAWGELMSLYKMNLIEFTPGKNAYSLKFFKKTINFLSLQF